MFIDTHCHLNFKAFNKDLDTVIKKALKAGVEKFIIPGAKINSSKKALKIANKYSSCFAAIGIHPHHANDYSSKEKFLSAEKELLELSSFPKVVAIGEIGLDYHLYKDYPPLSTETKDIQRNLFISQLTLAANCNLPVIFHCREAYDDMIDILKQFLLTNQAIRGVFHCFSGNEDQLAKILEMGFMAGFDGNVTYKENIKLQEILNLVPINRLLLETDSPYLTPHPYRGQRNEPSYIEYLYEKAAEIKNLSLIKISEITRNNALNLFKLN